MTPAAALITARRQALISLLDSGGVGGRVRLVTAAGATLVTISLALPCGAEDSTGVALATTDYAQVLGFGDVAKAVLENSAGVWVGDCTTGLATDNPAPELPLPITRLYPGAFMRLIGSHIGCD